MTCRPRANLKVLHRFYLLLLLQGGSAFSPSLVQTPSTSRRQALDLAKELGCVTSDLADCLRASSVHTLNAAQTKVDVPDGLRW